MIKNEREYKITKSSMNQFRKSLEQIGKMRQDSKYDSGKLKLQEDAIKSIVKELREQLKEYDDLKNGKFQMALLNGVEAIPSNLIRARIALGWTQKDLAERLGTTEQQIQKYESSDYKSASFKKLLELAGLFLNENSKHH